MVITVTVMAVPAKKGIWKTLKLQDGTEVRAQLVGDEFGHHWRTQSGQRFISVNGVLEEETAAARQNAAQRRAQAQQRRASRLSRPTANGLRRSAPDSHLGDKKGLIILVNFKDTKFQEENNQALYNNIANTPGYTDENGFKGSVSDYFKAQSGGKFKLTFDVVGPVTVSKKASYYGENDANGDDKNPQEMVVEAINLAKDQVTNWKQYDWDNDGEADQVMIIYAGEGEADGGADDTIWPHEWELRYVDEDFEVADGVRVNTYAVANEGSSQQDYWTGIESFYVNGIGTICHEFSHCLGLMDMYDVSYSGYYGMGKWTLMDSGSYNGDGFVPSGYTSYDKYCIGWIEPTELTTATTVSGMRALADTDADDVYMIKNAAHPDEYYLLENRQKTGWDAELPNNGMLILHVDYDPNIWNFNLVNSNNDGSNGYPVNDHQRCTIFHADGVDKTGEIYAQIEEALENYYAAETDEEANKYLGLYYDLWDQYDADEKGDVYPQPNNNQLTNTSVPRAFTYNANSDGRKLMNIAITDITQNADGTISFKFAPDNTGTEEGDNTVYGQIGGGSVKPTGDYLFYESFDQCDGTGANDGEWGSTVAGKADNFLPDNDGWISEAYYGGYQCARFGSGKKVGVATSPAISLTNEAVLTFKAAAWGSDGKELKLSAEGATVIFEPATVTMKGSEWTEYTVKLTGAGTAKLVFTPAKRFFLDEVLVVDPNATAIQTINTNKTTTTRIYTIDGRYVGTDPNLLPRGLYIINGKKIVK